MKDQINAELKEKLLKELPIAVFLNGRHLTSLSIYPENIKEFINGYLYTEQIIKNNDEIESIKIEQNRISVLTRNIFSGTLPKKTILSGCGGSVSYIDPGQLPIINSSVIFSKKDLYTIIKKFEDKSFLSEGFLFYENELIHEIDLDSVNVVDKLVGHTLIKGIESLKCAILINRPIKSEIVRKCLVGLIPMIITTSVATDVSYQIASKNGLTLGIYGDTKKIEFITESKNIN